MTTKSYDWGGDDFYDCFSVEEACEKLTGIEPADEKDAVDRLNKHFNKPASVKYDEGSLGSFSDGSYFEGGHNED